MRGIVLSSQSQSCAAHRKILLIAKLLAGIEQSQNVMRKFPPKPGSHDEIALQLYQAATSVEQSLVTVSLSVYEENLRFEKVRLETIATLRYVSALLVPKAFPIQ